MYKSKLTELIKTLDSNHIETARKWVNSPVHNRHKDVVKLFDFLFTRQNLTALSLNKKRVFSYIYPGREFDDLRLRHLMTLSVNILENFVSFSVQSDNKFEKNIALVRYCRLHKTENLSNKYLRKVIREQEKSILHSKNTHYQGYKLSKEIISSSENENPSKNLKQLFHHHSHIFILETLQLAINNFSITEENIEEIPFLDIILSEIKAGAYKDSPLVKLYYSCFILLNKPLSFKLFRDLKKDILDQKNVIELSEQTELFSFIIGFCIERLDSKKHNYLIELFDLYESGLESGIFLDSRGFNPEIYQDILSTSLALKNHVRAASFVNKHTSLLPKKLQAQFNRYARAMLLYSKGVYKSAAMLLAADFADIRLKFASGALLLKIHYENNAGNDFETASKRFITLIKSKTTPTELVNKYYGFIETATAFHSEKGKKQQQKIIKESLKDKNLLLSERLWLQNQLKLL
jgi:hypothetical protein